MTQTIALMNELLALGLTEITNDRQRKNGTMMFFDPQTGCEYGIYKTGYVRRKIKKSSNPFMRTDSYIYQLNQRPATIISRHTINGHKFTFTTKSIILVHDLCEQLRIVIKAVKNYRKYYEKNYVK